MQDVIDKVEAAITRLGINATEARTQNKGQWNIAKNEATQLMIDVWEEHDHCFFQIISHISSLADPNNAAFLKLLLQENHGLCETAFTVLNDNVFLKFTAEATDMTEERIYKNITRLAYYNETFKAKMN